MTLPPNLSSTTTLLLLVISSNPELVAPPSLRVPHAWNSWKRWNQENIRRKEEGGERHYKGDKLMKGWLKDDAIKRSQWICNIVSEHSFLVAVETNLIFWKLRKTHSTYLHDPKISQCFSVLAWLTANWVLLVSIDYTS